MFTRWFDVSFDVLFMGLLQGLTEFLPVSSSGHLGLAKVLLGVSEPNLAFDLMLHLATLLAVLIYFSRDIASLFKEWVCGFFDRNARTSAGWRFAWAVILGTAVTGPLGILLKPWAETASTNMAWLGGNFWITGLLLFSSKFIREGTKTVTLKDGALVGLVQGLAVMPGVSRSGSTIWAGLLCGMTREEAFRFSFLLSVPAIVGATLYEAKDLGGGAGFLHALPAGWIWGALVAFVSGLASLVLLKKLVTSDKWWFFAIYCMLLGTLALALSFAGA